LSYRNIFRPISLGENMHSFGHDALTPGSNKKTGKTTYCFKKRKCSKPPFVLRLDTRLPRGMM
jgi:hypothetical protein